MESVIGTRQNEEVSTFAYLLLSAERIYEKKSSEIEVQIYTKKRGLKGTRNIFRDENEMQKHEMLNLTRPLFW